MTISMIRACQRYKVLLPHFQLDWTFKRSEVLLPHFRFVLTATDLKFRFRSVLTAKDLKLRFHTALTTNNVKFRFRIFALLWLPMMWHELRSALLLCQLIRRCEVPLLHFRPVLTAKDMKFSFHTSVLPGLLKVWSFASTLLLCLDWHRCEIRLSKLLFCQDFESSQVPLSHFFDQYFQRREGPLPHFISAGTSKDVKFRFRTSALPWLSKIWSLVSLLTLCFNCQKCEIPLRHFRSAMTAKQLKFRFSSFVLSSKLRFCPSAYLDCQRCAVLFLQFRCMFLCHEGLAI